MTKLIGLIGISLVCLAAMAYFNGIEKGLYSGFFVFGGGLFLDSLKK